MPADADQEKKIVTIRPGMAPVVQFGDPNPELVETLERMLVEAKSGLLVGMAYVVSTSDLRSKTGWINTSTTSDSLGSGILTLAFRYGQDTAG